MHSPSRIDSAGCQCEFGPFSLEHDVAYAVWRREKLNCLAGHDKLSFIAVHDITSVTREEHEAICRQVRQRNFAPFRTQLVEAAVDDHCQKLCEFASNFGLHELEAQRSANGTGVVALEVARTELQSGYIPYTDRKLGWHTDGYYNYSPPHRVIQGMLLFCIRAAKSGGANQFLDHDVAYIKLRDLDPRYVKALMHPTAMTIPENREPDGTIRPANTGPVFVVSANGKKNGHAI